MKRSPAHRLKPETDVDEFAYVIVLPYPEPTKLTYVSAPWGRSSQVTPELALDLLVDAWVQYNRNPYQIKRPRTGEVIELVQYQEPRKMRERWERSWYLQPAGPPPMKPREVKPWERGVPLGIYFYEVVDET